MDNIFQKPKAWNDCLTLKESGKRILAKSIFGFELGEIVYFDSRGVLLDRSNTILPWTKVQAVELTFEQ